MSKFTKENLLSREQVIEIMLQRKADKPMGEEVRNRETDTAQELRSPAEVYDAFLSDNTFYDIDGELCRVLPQKARRILTEKGGKLGSVEFIVQGDPNDKGFFNLILNHERRLMKMHLNTYNKIYKFFYAKTATTEPNVTGQHCVFTGATMYYSPQPAGVYISAKALAESVSKEQKDTMKGKLMEANGETYLAMVVDGIVKFQNDEETKTHCQAAEILLNILDNRNLYIKQVEVEYNAAAFDEELTDILVSEAKKVVVEAGLDPHILA